MTTNLVAEIGINHNGSFGTFDKMAHDFLLYADFVKLQMRTPELCVPKTEWNKPKMWGGKMMTYMEYKRLVEFSPQQYDEIDFMYHGQWSCSVWDIEALRRAAKYDLPFIKIPSAKLTDLELIAEAARLFPIVMSTGMSTYTQVETAVCEARKHTNEITLLACTSTYPCEDNEINLSAINTIRENFKTEVGFSSHSKSPYPAIYSMFYGAEFIEVHATLDRTSEGSDHMASIEPRGFELIRREIDRIPDLIGDGIVRVYDSEIEPMMKLRGQI